VFTDLTGNRTISNYWDLALNTEGTILYYQSSRTIPIYHCHQLKNHRSHVTTTNSPVLIDTVCVGVVLTLLSQNTSSVVKPQKILTYWFPLKLTSGNLLVGAPKIDKQNTTPISQGLKISSIASDVLLLPLHRRW
jgi:hypothetical protein